MGRHEEYVQHGPIACYRCSWKWDGFPDYYANHQDELYFVFLDMEGLTTEFLADVFGMSGYRRGKGRQGIDTISVKQIVSKIPIHLTEDKKFFRVAPDPIMGTVATAIGLGDVLISTVRSEKPRDDSLIEPNHYSNVNEVWFTDGERRANRVAGNR